jgi:hypothetical protein
MNHFFLVIGIINYLFKMKRKSYLKPTIEVLMVENCGLLADSGNTQGTGVGVNNGNVKPKTGDDPPYGNGAKGYSSFEDNEEDY